MFLVFGGASALVILVLVAIGAWRGRETSAPQYPNGFRADRPVLGRQLSRRNGQSGLADTRHGHGYARALSMVARFCRLSSHRIFSRQRLHRSWPRVSAAIRCSGLAAAASARYVMRRTLQVTGQSKDAPPACT